jgi:hypothetical protein
MPKRAGAGAVLASALAVLALAGCTDKVIDDDKAEDAVQADLERGLEVKVESVDCPSDVEVDPQQTFECTVVAANGDVATATLRIRNEDADLRFIALKPQK